MAGHKLPVSIYMSTPTYTVQAGDSLTHAHEIMLARAVSCLAVVEGDSQLVGVLSRSDLLHIGAAAERKRWSRALVLPDEEVRSHMTREPISVPIGASMADAARVMIERHVHRVFVTAVADVAGVVSTQDIMRALADLGMDAPVSAFMTSPIQTVESHQSINAATEQLERSRVHGLVVVERGLPIGVFADVDALEARDWPPDHAVDQVMNTRILCLPTDTPMHRAAEQASSTRARRVLCMAPGGALAGILTGIDFARALVSQPSS